MRFDVALAGALFALTLWYMYHRASGSIRVARAGMFDACSAFLADFHLEQDGIGFPRAKGNYRGHTVRLEPIIDQMSFRTLPSLWISLTVECPVPCAGVLALLVRPRNTEYYSPAWELPDSVPLPTGWPTHAILRTDRSREMPSLKAIDAEVIRVFADEKTKELVISPRGIRIVYQLAQVERGNYLVLRELKFESIGLSGELFSKLADQALALQGALVADTSTIPA